MLVSHQGEPKSLQCFVYQAGRISWAAVQSDLVVTAACSTCSVGDCVLIFIAAECLCS